MSATHNVASTRALPGASPDRARRHRRRNYLVDRRMQLRVAGLMVAIVLALLVFVNLTLYTVSAERARALVRADPQLAELARAQDRAVQVMILLGSAVFVAGVFLVSIVETHRTAGACVALARGLREVGSGRLGVELRLRHDDDLHDIEPAFNEMSAALARRAWDQVEELEALAAGFLDGELPPDPSNVARVLRATAARLRSRLDGPSQPAGSTSPASRNPLALSTQASQRPHARPSLDGS